MFRFFLLKYPIIFYHKKYLAFKEYKMYDLSQGSDKQFIILTIFKKRGNRNVLIHSLVSHNQCNP